MKKSASGSQRDFLRISTYLKRPTILISPEQRWKSTLGFSFLFCLLNFPLHSASKSQKQDFQAPHINSYQSY